MTYVAGQGRTTRVGIVYGLRVPTSPGILVNLPVYGRRTRAARILAGYDRVEDAAAAVSEHAGVTVSARTMGAIERGEQMPSLEQHLAILCTFVPPDTVRYFAPAFDERVDAWIQAAGSPSPGAPGL